MWIQRRTISLSPNFKSSMNMQDRKKDETLGHCTDEGQKPETRLQLQDAMKLKKINNKYHQSYAYIIQEINISRQATQDFSGFAAMCSGSSCDSKGRSYG